MHVLMIRGRCCSNHATTMAASHGWSSRICWAIWRANGSEYLLFVSGTMASAPASPTMSSGTARVAMAPPWAWKRGTMPPSACGRMPPRALPKTLEMVCLMLAKMSILPVAL